MFFYSQKNKAIKSYLMILPKLMNKDYGKSTEYSAMQVIKSIERYKLNTKYQAFAVALYCSKEEFNSYFNNEGSKYEYQQMRNVISKMYFDNCDFTHSDIIKLSLEFSKFENKNHHSNLEGNGGI